MDFGFAEVVIAGEAADGGVLRHDPAVLRRDLRLGLPAGVHRGVPRGPRPGLRLLRRGARGGSATTTRRSPWPRSPAAASRKLTDEFLRLKSHHLFEYHFCLVRRPNEKGHVETLVGFARRNFLVPVPARARRRWSRSTPGSTARCRAGPRRGGSGASRRPRPSCSPRSGRRCCRCRPSAFVAAPGRAARASTRCRWSASTPTTTRCRPRTPTTRSRSSATVDDGPASSPATAWWPSHRRCWGREQVTYDPVHYLALLERKPGALDFAAPAGGLGVAGLLRRPAAAAGGRARRAGDAAVHQGPAAAGEGAPRRADAGGRAGAGARGRRRRRGAADPGAPAGAAGRRCSASTAGRT